MTRQDEEDLAYTEEMRLLMLDAWGRFALGVEGSGLINVDRLTKLFAIIDNPYHRAMFAGRSNLDLMRACVWGMLESMHYKEAFRALDRIERIERERAREGYVEPERPTVATSAEPLPPSPVEMPPRPPYLVGQAAQQAWVDSLSPQELERHLKAALRERQRLGLPPPYS